jgi:hypothetical protein
VSGNFKVLKTGRPSERFILQLQNGKMQHFPEAFPVTRGYKMNQQYLQLSSATIQ